MQYSTVLQPVFFILFLITCTAWASAIPVNALDVGDTAMMAGANFIPYLEQRDPEGTLVEEASLNVFDPEADVDIYIPDELLTNNPSFDLPIKPSFVKRTFGAPACWKAPNGYGHRNVALQGVRWLRENPNIDMVVPKGFKCGVAWCRNYKTHKTAIIVCAWQGFRVKSSRVAAAAEKLANTCRRENWKVNGLLKDTSGYDIRVSGAGCG
ncbi:hypothetical protein TWF481_005333 [Arthrobotrys musiformis]|uniref:Secreted protein n=1 Tax=Arthrobotrys musiformis TaxID=47236 RepID=A0AAV9WDK9_9PEZI